MGENDTSLCTKKFTCGIISVGLITLIIGLFGGYYGCQFLTPSESFTQPVITDDDCIDAVF